MSVRVRPVTEADFPAWLDLFRAYIAFYEESVPDDVIDATWRRIVSSSDNMCGLIAESGDGRALGIANLVFHRSTWSSTWYCYLEDLFVAPEVRGEGVGGALIEATYAEADRRGASRTYWATKEDNRVARTLYDRVGVLTEFVQYRR